MFAVKNITMVRGDTLAFDSYFDNLDTSLSSAYFTAKANLEDAEPAFQVSLGEGITEIEGGIHIRRAPELTASLDPGAYFYDFQIGIGSDVYTLMLGQIDLILGTTEA